MMNLAKQRIALRNSFKMHCGAFFIVSAVIAMNSLFNNWGIGVVLFILGWGLLVAFHGVLVCFRLLDVSASVTGEYERIRRTAMNERNFSNEGQRQNDISKLPTIEDMAHENETKQEYKQASKTMTEERKLSNKGMDEQKKARLIKIYNRYQVVDWIIAILITAALFFGISFPAAILTVIFIVGFAYTAWTVWLYIKVWHIKEIRNTGVYVFDWALTIGLTVFEAYVFYIVLTNGVPFWARLLETIY